MGRKLYSQMSMSFCKVEPVPGTQGNTVPASKHEYKPVAVGRECRGICARTDLGLSLVVQLYEEKNLKSHLVLGITVLRVADIPLDTQPNLLHWTTYFCMFSLREVLCHPHRVSVSYASTFLKICLFK